MKTETAQMIALELCCSHFAALIESAKLEAPQSALERISELESRLRTVEAAQHDLAASVESMRKQIARMEEVVRIAKAWRKDHYSPRLEGAVDAYLRAEAIA